MSLHYSLIFVLLILPSMHAQDTRQPLSGDEPEKISRHWPIRWRVSSGLTKRWGRRVATAFAANFVANLFLLQASS